MRVVRSRAVLIYMCSWEEGHVQPDDSALTCVSLNTQAGLSSELETDRRIRRERKKKEMAGLESRTAELLWPVGLLSQCLYRAQKV